MQTKYFNLFILNIILLLSSTIQAKQGVTIVTRGKHDKPAKYGLQKLQQAIEAKGITVTHDDSIAGPNDNFVIYAGKFKSTVLPKEAESFAIKKLSSKQKQKLILSGFDAVGLMYAALDTAERISWADDPADLFKFVKDTSEKPAIKQRSISIYSMQRAYFEQRLFDEDYFEKYFDMLAKNRFNHFVLVLGYHNMCYFEPLYTSPAYPYFFDVEGFEQVKFGQITAQDQKKHVQALKKIIQLAHDRGIKFGIGLWDHVADHGDKVDMDIVYEPDKIPENFIVGLNKDNLNDYTRVAFAKFLKTFSEIDSLQLRLHWESGLKASQLLDFSHVLFEVIKEHRPDMPVDIRAKDVPDEVYNDALETGIKLRVATKYWMEQMGLPFHPTHINPQNQHDRRQGYADLLKYPQRYKVHFRLWNGGTSRILLWANPEYVRRFCDSVKIYDGDSFEINEPLVLKMNGQKHQDKPFDLLNPNYQYYDHEFERYWHFYQAFGRVSYDPNCDPQIWQQEFARRFGKAGEPLTNAIHQGSKILPMIVAASFPYSNFPTPKGWSEMKTFGTLAEFAKIQGSDVQQFLNPSDAAKYLIEGTESPMRHPADTSRWFAEKSLSILENLAKAEEIVGTNKSKEFISTVTDMKILAHLADFHSNRLIGAVNYNLFNETKDLFALDQAISSEEKSLEAWKNIVAAAGDVYCFDIKMGNQKADLKDHWRDWLPSLEKSLENLNTQRDSYQPNAAKDKPFFAHVPVRKLVNNELIIRATVKAGNKINELSLLVSDGSVFKKMPMKEVGKWRYEARFLCDLENNLKYHMELKTESGIIIYPGKDTDIVVMVNDDQPPKVEHNKITNAPANEDMEISAKVTDPSKVKWVRLRYRHLTQFEDYQTLEMEFDQKSGLYSAVIPGDFIIPKWDLMYFIESMDNKNNGSIYPDLEEEMPYVIVELSR